jgi:hypothetical protein
LNAERIAQLREQAATGANRTKLAKEFGIAAKRFINTFEKKVQEFKTVDNMAAETTGSPGDSQPHVLTI